MAKRGRKEKDNWKKKRRQEYLEKKEFRYYIFCEGQATEPKYFQGFKRYIEDNPIYRDMVLIEIEGCQDPVLSGVKGGCILSGIWL